MAGSIITLTDASKMTADFRAKFPNETRSYYYSDTVYKDILSQKGCVGIRIYNGLDASGVMHAILVGVDANGNDLYNGKIYQYSVLCPPICPPKNPLNS
jgi:hypothetical protein